MSNLQDLCDAKGLKASVKYGGKTRVSDLPHDDWRYTARHWTVTLKYQGRQMSVEFWQGSAHTKEPTAADALSSIILDANCGEQTFEDFCSEFGYDSDSRKAEKTWKACAKTAPKVRRLLGDDFDLFAQAEH